MRRHVASITLVVLLAAALDAQAPAADTVDSLLDRFAAYITTYESQLTAIIANERYEQIDVVPGREYSIRARRYLESDVAFFRLPGNAEWTGFRAVRQADGLRIAGGGLRLADLLQDGVDIVSQARAITAASSKYNLGAPRTTNMPTVPLEIFHPDHRRRFNHRLGEPASIRGARTVRVDLDEIVSPTIIRKSGGGDMKSSGSLWIERETGAVWRAEVTFREPGVAPTLLDARLKVEFARDRRLGIMVPIEMRETFQVQNGRGEGKAFYSNFKRFETSGRIVQ